MPTNLDNDVENLVLQALPVGGEPTEMNELVKRVRQESTTIDEFEVRRAAWRLMDRQQVELRNDRRLERKPTNGSG